MATKKVQLEIDESVLTALQELVDAGDAKDLGEALTKAVATHEFLAKNAEGKKILYRSGNQFREVDIA